MIAQTISTRCIKTSVCLLPPIHFVLIDKAILVAVVLMPCVYAFIYHPPHRTIFSKIGLNWVNGDFTVLSSYHDDPFRINKVSVTTRGILLQYLPIVTLFMLFYL